MAGWVFLFVLLDNNGKEKDGIALEIPKEWVDNLNVENRNSWMRKDKFFMRLPLLILFVDSIL